MTQSKLYADYTTNTHACIYHKQSVRDQMWSDFAGNYYDHKLLLVCGIWFEMVLLSALISSLLSTRNPKKKEGSLHHLILLWLQAMLSTVLMSEGDAG